MNKTDNLCVNALRMLSVDAIQSANSGHPGLPLGAAPAAFAIWKNMKHNPADPTWADRDRFVLSAGHGSALLYSLLHLFGYDVSIEDLKSFRKFGSKTPGHPEYGHTPGVETTTGPLGQGIANAVGMAMAEAHLSATFNRPSYEIVNHYTYALCGDGCLMEGISGEASSLAGTLKLGKLIVFYDDNGISIEGNTDIAFCEDVGKRYEAYGWQVLRVSDANDIDALSAAIKDAQGDTTRPSIIIVESIIGYGSPDQGSHSIHGTPLGAENIRKTRAFLGFPEDQDFYVPQDCYDSMNAFRAQAAQAQNDWNALFDTYSCEYPDLSTQWNDWFHGKLGYDLLDDPSFMEFKASDATRNSSGIALNRISNILGNLFGGSADLEPSNKSGMSNSGYFSAEDRTGSNIHFGVREHAMAAISNGIALHGGLRAYAATFFIFCDYMKHSMRLSALMGLPLTYILSHDSIGVGEDGPTHEPVEQLASLRSIPGFTVIRPADGKESAVAWCYAMNANGPTAIVTSRQNLPLLDNTGKDALKGAYILKDGAKAELDVILMASGSEVELILKAAEVLEGKGLSARVVSMPSWELFEAQDAAYKQSVLPSCVRARVAVEAASGFGWERYTGLDGTVICMQGFGASGDAKVLFEHFGFTVEHVVESALALLG